MYIYFPTWSSSPQQDTNPFISTLVDSYKGMDPKINFLFGAGTLWEECCMNVDIIHIMWPQNLLFKNEHSEEETIQRLIQLQKNGVKIVVTCHNINPHYAKDEPTQKIYSDTYKIADVIIHLGNYSMSYMKNLYPEKKNILIPHHVYDTIYPTIPDRKESKKKLNLSPNLRYIITLGTFRDDEERALLMSIGRALRWTNTYIIAPQFCPYKYEDIMNSGCIKDKINWHKLKYLYHIISYGEYIDNETLPYYYGAAEVSLIQRKKILNSGNVPLGLMMENIVVGPDLGNISEILKTLNNPVFNPNSEKSAVKAIKEGLKMAKCGISKTNREYAMQNLRTEIIARKHLGCYYNLANDKQK